MAGWRPFWAVVAVIRNVRYDADVSGKRIGAARYPIRPATPRMNDHREMPAEPLMARFVGRNDAGAFNEIVSRFLAPALGVAHQMLSGHASAEDAVQECFLRVVRFRRQYDPSRPFSTWFYSILRNVCRDMLRRQGREARLISAVADLQPTQAAPPPAAGESGGASSILSGLPEAERAVLTLRVVHDLSFRDVAAALDISVEAAKKRAQRGLQRLRESGRAAKMLDSFEQESA